MQSKKKQIQNDLERQYPVNDEITAEQVRLVGDNVPNPGIYKLEDAMKLAEEMGLDLVLISSQVNPPVCKILDYQKFIYQQKQKQKEIKAKSAKVIVKEIRFGPNTDEHDYNFKLKHAINFLQDGAKVKAYVFFKGRSIMYTEQGENLLRKFIEDLSAYAKVEQEPKLDGKRMIVILSPLQKKRIN